MKARARGMAAGALLANGLHDFKPAPPAKPAAAPTPGPWTVESVKGDRVVGIGGGGVNGYGDGPAEYVLSPVTGEMSEADAALACAAPDLLAAAENAVEWCCGKDGEKNFGDKLDGQTFCSACAPLVAAIAKARGK